MGILFQFVFLFFSEIIASDFLAFCQQYKALIQVKENDAIDLKVFSFENPPKADSRHRFYLRFKFEYRPVNRNFPPYPIKFYVTKLENPESNTFRCSEPTSGKDFCWNL